MTFTPNNYLVILYQLILPVSEKERSIVITWSTGNKTDSIVKYGGGDQLLQRKSGSSSLFVDGGHKQASQYIHRVTIYYEDPDSLQPETKYCMLFLKYFNELPLYFPYMYYFL